jgi:hypothetical protein
MEEMSSDIEDAEYIAFLIVDVLSEFLRRSFRDPPPGLYKLVSAWIGEDMIE